MDSSKDLNEVAEKAQKGLSLNPDSKKIILAHFVLADIYNRIGRHQEFQKYVNLAKQFQNTPSQ